jgi:nucleoside-diphosphate-sugar epimerase
VKPAVLVTGAAGFIGQHLVRTLAQRGVQVRAVDIQPSLQQAEMPGVQYIQQDLRDAGALPELLAGVTTVYHLASAHLQATASESQFREVNVDAAVALVRSAAQAGVRRFVHASTVGIYGHVVSPPATEDSPTAPGNMYERTKLLGENAVRQAATDLGLELIVLRPAWVYGPGCPRTEKLLRSVAKRRFFYVGDGRNLRHPVFIDDAVEAFILAAGSPACAAGYAYIIAGPRYVELRELVATCARVLGADPPARRLPRPLLVAAGRVAELVWGLAGREPPFSRRSLAFFENDNAFDTTAARTDLKFEAQVELEDGLRRTSQLVSQPVAH